MVRPLSALAPALVLGALAATASATPLAPEKAPAPLRPWVDWALSGAEDFRCPFLSGSADRVCAWPARLELAVHARGGSFRQEWQAFSESLVPLPGDPERWPLDVRVDGSLAPVSGDEEPRVQLVPGVHVVTGAFAWDALPDSVHVPTATGLLSLTVNGARLDFPTRDREGRVFFRREAGTGQAEDRLELVVSRKVVDGVPLEVETRVELRASGKKREVAVAGALLPGFVPMALRSPLPAQLERGGVLRIQVRPGTGVITLTARQKEQAPAVALPAAPRPWPEEEAWVYEARPSFRVARVEGLPAIEPQQSSLPAEWRQLPAYRVRPGEALRLVEERRGDSAPGPDELTLRRALWLDFDGGGFTAQDAITGTLARGSRLDALPETELGRVSVNGQDQVITRVAPGGSAGVELRQRAITVSATSRIAGSRDIPAVGWAADVHAASAQLHLPPGWRLIHASGADDVPGTWLKRWTLLELFLALIVALAIGRLFGRWTGALALATMVLLFPEPEAPKAAWLAPLALEALLRVLPEGRWRSLLRLARVVAWAALALVAVPFAVGHLRTGLHPALERPAGLVFRDEAEDGTLLLGTLSAPRSAAPTLREVVAGRPAAPPPPRPGGAPAPGEATGTERQSPGKMADKLGSGSGSSYRGYADLLARLQQIDPAAHVQTGPGVPRWRWNAFDVRWSGPVERSQRLRLWLLPPWVNLLLALLRVALLALLVARLLGLPGKWPMVRAAGAAALIAAAALTGSARAGNFPQDEMLKALRQRLTELPACAPNCASASRLLLEVSPGTLRARLEVGAAARTAVALPGNAGEWSPRTVLLDGQPARALQRGTDGALWLALEPGTHQVQLEGPLPARETFQLALLAKPHRVEVRASGWRVEGVHEDGLADDDLVLTRLRRGGEGAGSPQGALPPFVRVERSLALGLTWAAETKIVRVTPAGSAVVLSVPLLPGESVTTAGVRVEGGKALVNLAPAQGELSWHSALEPRPELALRAPRGVEWVESWRVDAGPIWHVAVAGLPAIQPASPAEGDVPIFRPWPGETLTLSIARPGGIPGPTLTIDQASLVLQPGARATDATLSLSVRSSRGGQHLLTLPEGALLQHFAVNGLTQPLRQDGRKVAVPVVPGAQALKLTWREGRGHGLRFQGSEVDLGAPGANAEVRIEPGPGRWILFVGGPRLGPAVLFWSLLAALLLVALGLSRLRLTPLRAREWLLLGVGLATLPPWAAAIVAGWLLFTGWRAATPGLGPRIFDLRQVALVAWTLAALVTLFVAIEGGLLGAPDMQIRGNGSSAQALRWFQDRVEGQLPRPWVVSLPMGAYRVAMLAWALWIAASLLRWLRWTWGAFSTGGTWRPFRRPAPAAGPAEPAPPAG